MRLFIVLALLIAIVIIVFALQNSAIVTISFLSFHYTGSLALIVAILFTSGLLAGLLISLPSLLKKHLALREHKKRIKQLEGNSPGSSSSDSMDREKRDRS